MPALGKKALPKAASTNAKIRSVFLLGDPRKGAARTLLRSIEPWIRRHAKLAGVDFEGKADLSKLDADLLLVLGGDGSILYAARRMGERQIPTVGVNLGRLGFLAALSRDHLHTALARIFEGHYAIDERLMLRCRIRRAGKIVFETLALNDAVIARESISRMITVELSLREQDVIDYRCDGIVVSTPTGATGYSLSAGGPILDPRLGAFVVTPICPHTLTNRPLVIPSGERLSLRLAELSGKGFFNADGQEWRALGKNDVLEVEAAKPRFQLLAVEGGDFYSRLQRVLGWRGKMEAK